MGDRYVVRKAVYRRSHALYCTYCGARLCQYHRRKPGTLCPDAATWDHIIPISLDRAVNSVVGRGKVVACNWCNNDRRDRKIYDWFLSLRERLADGVLREPGLTKAQQIVTALNHAGLEHP